MSALSWVSKISGELGNKLSQVLRDRKPPLKGVGGASARLEELEPRRMLTTVSISAVSSVATEGGSAATFAVSCDYTGSSSLTVNYEIQFGTADSSDISGSLTGTLTFSASSSTSLITVVAADDSSTEPTEAFTVSLTGSSITFSPSNCAGSIIDNDATVTVTAPDSSASEVDEDTGRFTVHRDASNIDEALTVYYAVSGTATPDSPWDDYFPIGDQVVIPAGETDADIYVHPHNDAISETSESVILSLSSQPSGTHPFQYTVGSPGSATCTIANNAAPDSVIFKNNTRGGDLVVSAKDDANGVAGGTKDLDVISTGAAVLTIERTAGSTGSGKFVSGGSDVDTITVNNGDTFTIRGGQVSDQPRNMRIVAKIGGVEVGHWDFTVFTVQITSYHDTTDVMPAYYASTGGNLKTLLGFQGGATTLGYHAPPANWPNSVNAIMNEGKLLPASLDPADLKRDAVGGKGFDFRRFMTLRWYDNETVNKTNKYLYLFTASRPKNAAFQHF